MERCGKTCCTPWELCGKAPVSRLLPCWARADTAIFSAVQNVLLRPLPYPQPETLVEIGNTYPPQVPRGGLSPGDYADWRERAASFSEMDAYDPLTLFGVAALPIGVALAASYIPARRAARVDPLMALRFK